LGVICMDTGNEIKSRNWCGEHVHETQRRMIGHEMPAALCAILALTERRLLESRDVPGPRCDPHGLRLPEAEGVDRSARPGSAGTAMAVTHGFRRPGSFQLDRAAKATSDMRHY